MAFWKPQSSNSADRHDNDTILTNNKFLHMTLAQQRRNLPIASQKDNILYALEKFTTVVVTAETGSGKSTQLPQYLHEAGWSKGGRCIVCTQPRRMAAITVAARVADEFGCSLGEEVGYAVRFDSKCSSKTVIKYCTDGLLLRETMSDPLLSKYGVILVDEAHERSLQSDLMLGLLKKIQKKRSDLRIIVTSATVDAATIKTFFETNCGDSKGDRTKDTACVVSVQGRVHPVDIHYLKKPAANYIIAAAETVLKIHTSEDKKGDVLVFLPGAEEIDTCVRIIEERGEKYAQSLILIPLYSSLPNALQMRAFETASHGSRKVIIATNIAETSVTIEGVKFVVDAGLVKMKFFNVVSGIDALITCPVAKSSANQRAGRAGRTAPGKCYRLLTEQSFTGLEPFNTPEMQRTDITWAVLQLKALGIDDVIHFDFLSSPYLESLNYSLELLYSLGALDLDCKLTDIGEKMSAMPVEPRLAKCLLSSLTQGCSEEMLSIAAMCSVEYPHTTLRHSASMEAKQKHMECVSEFADSNGDHMTLLKIFQAFEERAGGRSSDNSNNNNSKKGDRIRQESVQSFCEEYCLQQRILVRAKEVRGHLCGMLRGFAEKGTPFSSCGDDHVTVRKCLVSGYFSNAAKLSSSGDYLTVRGNIPVTAHPNSIIARFGAPPEWIIFNEVVHSKHTMIREVSKIDPRWLLEIASHYFTIK